jgi:hypothetical protein
VAKAHIKQRADVRVAELELQQLLEADPVEMGKVEAKVKEVEGLRTALRLNWIKADEQAKSLLTPEQRQKLEHIHDRLHGMRGMRGEGGMGRMEMMGPQRLSGMSGGGTEGHVQSAQGAAGTQPLTQEDTQGGVTVSATLLTPDKPRPDATLAVQVTLVLRGIGGVPERVFQWPLGAGARR